jgi:sec-independent protein translocase protein TatC
MSLMEHLGELRMRLVRILVCLCIAACVFYLATPTVAQFLLAPVAEYMPQDASGHAMLNVLGAFDAFAVRLGIALWTSVVATMPIILWQILAFFLPALKPNERKWFIPTFTAAVLLFIAGTVFCYLIILDPAFQWLTDQAAGFAIVLPEASAWIDIIIKFELGFGIGFEMPLVVFYLVLFDVIPYAKLRASWRVVYVGLLVFSAMVTPDASPVTMGLMFAAMIGLYEISLLVARVALHRRDKRRALKEEREAAEAEEAREELRDVKRAFEDHLWGDERQRAELDRAAQDDKARRKAERAEAAEKKAAQEELDAKMKAAADKAWAAHDGAAQEKGE